MMNTRSSTLLAWGGLAGFAAAFVVSDRPSEPLLFVTAILGAVLTLAVRRYARF